MRRVAAWRRRSSSCRLLPGLRLADLLRDVDILDMARKEARALLEGKDNSNELRAVARYIQENWQRRYGLIQVG